MPLMATEAANTPVECAGLNLQTEPSTQCQGGFRLYPADAKGSLLNSASTHQDLFILGTEGIYLPSLGGSEVFILSVKGL